MKHTTIIEPFRIKTVEPIHFNTREERNQLLKEVHYNLFGLEAQQVIIDLLTDSGTSAMSSKQWASLMQADESYAGSQSWTRLQEVIQKMTGFPHVFPTHQGRAAEHILFGLIGGSGKTFISNTFFDTTRANVEASGATAMDCPVDPSTLNKDEKRFQGNMNLIALEEKLRTSKTPIAGVVLTVTNNSVGGQPVSMSNAVQVKQLCRVFNIPMYLDACRIAENAYFVKHHEPNFINYSAREIALQFFRLSDGVLMSAKKDGLVNMGGFFATRNAQLQKQFQNALILKEGYVTYGGMSSRDLEAMASGLEEVFDEDYLRYRMASTDYLGLGLKKIGIPVLYPTGGHAVYIDAQTFYPHLKPEDFPGQVMACELYRNGGIRSCEVGSVMFGRYNTKKQFIPAQRELLRLALPRRVYTMSHLDYIIETFEFLKLNALQARGLQMTYRPKQMPHFTAKFEEKE